MTPLGAPVEPEVYWRNAIVSLVTADSIHSFSALLSRLSVVSHRSGSRYGFFAKSGTTRERMGAVVIATVAPASATIVCSLSSDRLGRGGYAGTATAPAYKQPKNAATYSSSGG